MEKKDNRNGLLLWFGFIVLVLCFAYLFGVTFLKVPPSNLNVELLILGFVSGLGTSVTGYFFSATWTPPHSIGDTTTTHVDAEHVNISNDESPVGDTQEHTVE